MSEKKSKELKEKLFYNKKNGLLKVSAAEYKRADKYCEGYKAFLNVAKTEREAVKEAVKMAEAKGFSMRNTRRAPAMRMASIRALRFTSSMPQGMEMIIRGFPR